jgi:hypothetical protein
MKNRCPTLFLSLLSARRCTCPPVRRHLRRRPAARAFLHSHRRPASPLRPRTAASLPLFTALLCAIFLLCAATQLCPAALADPFPLGEDLSEMVTVFYNGKDASDGQYVYTCRFPVIADSSELSAVCVNEYYSKKLQEDLTFYVLIDADDYGSRYQSVTKDVSYTITCNNDDYFSVLIRKATDLEDGEHAEEWEGNTFSRTGEMVGQVTSLPNLLGEVESGESDDWLEDRQSEKVCEVLCDLIWQKIQSGAEGLVFRPDLKKEDLELLINPMFSLDHDFYMNESGDLVFFFRPGSIAPEEAGLITFTFPLEDLLDEL